MVAFLRKTPREDPRIWEGGNVVVPPFYSDFSLNFGRFYKPEQAIQTSSRSDATLTSKHITDALARSCCIDAQKIDAPDEPHG